MKTMNHAADARFVEAGAWDSVTCRICPHLCSIAPSRAGSCGVRTNRGGVLMVDNYGKVASVDVVDAEDLPLYHYKPSLRWMRLGTKGCTMRCPFCNTWKFSQVGAARTTALTPEELVAEARRRECDGISFGINEPAPSFEFVADVAALARHNGLEIHLATSGMWCEEPLREVARRCNAITIGLKGLHDRLCQDVLGADKEALLRSIAVLLACNVHLEISWLVLPSLSDNVVQAQELVDFLYQRGAQPPIILLQYQPDYQWAEQTQPASLETMHHLMACFENYPGHCYVVHPESPHRNTRCRKCRRTLVRRGEARLVITSHPETGRPKDRCPSCGEPVPYVIG